jgi:predicted nucleic acid-binding protein
VSTLLLDASVILAAFDSGDSHHAPAAALLGDDSVTVATLDLARYEVANVAIRAWRAPDAVATLIFALDRIADDGGVIVSTGTLLTRAADLAERHGISVYDAAYVAAVGEGDRRLVSCDERDLVSKELAVLPETEAIWARVNPAPEGEGMALADAELHAMRKERRGPGRP